MAVLVLGRALRGSDPVAPQPKRSQILESLCSYITGWSGRKALSDVQKRAGENLPFLLGENMSWTGISSGSLGGLKIAFEERAIRNKYVNFLNSGVVHLDEHKLAEEKWITTIYSASFVIAPTKPINYINVDFHVDKEKK